MSDLISRAEAIEAIEFGITYLKAINTKTGEVTEPFAKINDELREAVNRVKELPSAQKTGKWIDMDEQSYTWKVRCSVCGHERSMMSTQGEYPNYCENCGARMVEE